MGPFYYAEQEQNRNLSEHVYQILYNMQVLAGASTTGSMLAVNPATGEEPAIQHLLNDQDSQIYTAEVSSLAQRGINIYADISTIAEMYFIQQKTEEIKRSSLQLLQANWIVYHSLRALFRAAAFQHMPSQNTSESGVFLMNYQGLLDEGGIQLDAHVIDRKYIKIPDLRQWQYLRFGALYAPEDQNARMRGEGTGYYTGATLIYHERINDIDVGFIPITIDFIAPENLSDLSRRLVLSQTFLNDGL